MAQIITLLRHLDIARITDFQNTGDLRARVLNDQLDYLITAIQQVNERVDRCLLRPFTSISAADLSLPEPEPGKVLGWNGTANGLENKSLELIGVTESVLAAAEKIRAEVKQHLEHVQAHASTAQTAARQMAEQIGAATWPLITGKPETFPASDHTFYARPPRPPYLNPCPDE